MLFLECNEGTCIERCLQRGAAGSGRSDDNEETLKKRIHTFHKDSLPIVEYYRHLNLVKSVDASKSKEEVFEEIKQLFSQV